MVGRCCVVPCSLASGVDGAADLNVLGLLRLVDCRADSNWGRLASVSQSCLASAGLRVEQQQPGVGVHDWMREGELDSTAQVWKALASSCAGTLGVC